MFRFASQSACIFHGDASVLCHFSTYDIRAYNIVIANRSCTRGPFIRAAQSPSGPHNLPTVRADAECIPSAPFGIPTDTDTDSCAPLVGAASEADRPNPHPPIWSLPFAHTDAAHTPTTPRIQFSDRNSVPSSSVRWCTAARTELSVFRFGALSKCHTFLHQAAGLPKCADSNRSFLSLKWRPLPRRRPTHQHCTVNCV